VPGSPSGDDRVIDRFASARAVADAVLYEGYVLYPYRASSRKNQVRWQFGVLTPRAFSEADGFERWWLRTECLVDPGRKASLAVRIRCLQVQHRSVDSLAPMAATAGSGTEVGDFMRADSLAVDGNLYVDWDEAVDKIVDLPPVRLVGAGEGEREETFRFPGGTDTELIHSADGAVAGRIVRRREAVMGRVRLATTAAGAANRLLKVTVTVENLTEWTGLSAKRDEVMSRSLVAVHSMLAIEDGIFLSLLDPPEDARQAVAGCHSDGAFPVLIGDDHVVLSSPIILYDHPEVAPESPGDLYDATEIDEILALRVLTLTDEEKSEARGTDPRAAAIIDRCDDMSPEIWDRLHGTMRSVRPVAEQQLESFPEVPAGSDSGEPHVPGEPTSSAVPWWDPTADASVDPWTDSVVIGGVEVHKGTAVTLRPSHRADAQDIFLGGLEATVAGVFKDVDGSEHVAVTIDDDPATSELVWQGRYLFFHPDEVVPRAARGAER
jgi:hypothetical protein